MSENDYVLGKYGPLPNDPVALKAGLKYALKLIGSYEMDCRNIEDYVTPQNMGRGFCQGSIYREGVADIFRAMGVDIPESHG